MGKGSCRTGGWNSAGTDGSAVDTHVLIIMLECQGQSRASVTSKSCEAFDVSVKGSKMLERGKVVSSYNYCPDKR